MLVENDFFTLYIEGEEVFIDLQKIGFPLKSFELITNQHPRIKISSFPELRKALMEVGEKHKIGYYLPIIDIQVSQNKMRADVLFNVTSSQLENEKARLISQAEKALDEYGIVFGRTNLAESAIYPCTPIVAAVGQDPVKGQDAKITYIARPERKPVIREDGIADYYEMNFVTHVQEGDWLGEKIPPQEGTPGRDIFGVEIAALRGTDAKLLYDRKAVIEVDEDGKTVLRAMFGGALEFTDDDVVSVSRELIINGDVGPETGSITFEGAVTIYGTVLAGYSVKATGDISIEGNEGVTNAKEICSSEGDIYIKGGAFGGDMSLIEASGDLFIKHANNCKIYAKNLYVGLYILGSEVVADHVFVDKNRGKIIGGRIEALFSIESAYAGNVHERLTHLIAKGIDKDRIYEDIQQIAQELKDIQTTVSTLEEQLAKIDQLSGNQLLGEQANVYAKLRATLDASRSKMFELDQDIQMGLRKIKVAEPPRIHIAKEAHAGVVIQIGQLSRTITSTTTGTFEVIDQVLHV
ncbi:DUF342 domain-containing protein [Sporosarcina sp. ITBMC105]